MGILDTIRDVNLKHSLTQPEVEAVVKQILEPLQERERSILELRYGLKGSEPATLRAVGDIHDLTRERVRQIEKDLLHTLRSSAQQLESFMRVKDALLLIIDDHGGAVSQHNLLEFAGAVEIAEINNVKFLLQLMHEVQHHEADQLFHELWSHVSFNREELTAIITAAYSALEEYKKPISADEFKKLLLEHATIKNASLKNEKLSGLLPHYLKTTHTVQQNPFQEYGLHDWHDISPRDVGDKAYVVMRHHGKPEHYAQITELINKHFPGARKAYKETVHNKLIKDKRFVLVGRGLYALAEWGYKSGVVADIIEEVLRKAAKPLTKEEIIEAVLKHRIVKKNTILVGLSNKKRFSKIEKNLYTIRSVPT